MPLGSFDLSRAGTLSANVDRMHRGQDHRRQEQEQAIRTRKQLPGFMQGLSGFGGGSGFDAFGPGHDGRWDGFWQGIDDASGGGNKPIKTNWHSTSGGTMKVGPTYDPRFQGSAVDGVPVPGGGGTSFGADAEIARRVKALQLAGLDVAEDQTRLAGESQGMRQQRRNLAAHGTIEDPTAFTQRTGQEDAAALLDDRTPQGQLRSLQAQEKLRQATEAARIAAEGRRDVAGISAGASRYGADQRLQGQQDQAAAGRDAALLRAFDGILTSRYSADQDVARARGGMAGMQGDDVAPEPVAPEPQSLWQWLRGRNTQSR